jgi:hypothetical protein
MFLVHLPFSALLIYIGFTENPTIVLLILLAKHLTSQMDVPAQKALISLLTSPEELKNKSLKSIIAFGRTIGMALSLAFNGFFMSLDIDVIGFSVPFLIAGGLRIIIEVLFGLILIVCKKKKP